ncbi:DUF998 domain-containing protein [Candidatus Thorarchaeota archaeon]|nr:MAG: DUF998 domain-containing protein [Candidatus Thorarchaeota archaeon]
MTTDTRKIPLITVCGIIVILFYCTFTIISWALYPAPYSPLTHYLSRLGNFDYSPLGAYFYNCGCILTGLALIPFFMSLRTWYTERRFQVYLLIIGQIFGILSAIALIMIGIFSEDQGVPHLTASSLFFILNFIVLILVNLSLIWHPHFFKPIAVYGIAIDFISLGLESAISGPIVEWFTVFGSLFFVALISANSFVSNRSHYNSHYYDHYQNDHTEKRTNFVL